MDRFDEEMKKLAKEEMRQSAVPPQLRKDIEILLDNLPEREEKAPWYVMYRRYAPIAAVFAAALIILPLISRNRDALVADMHGAVPAKSIVFEEVMPEKLNLSAEIAGQSEIVFANEEWAMLETEEGMLCYCLSTEEAVTVEQLFEAVPEGIAGFEINEAGELVVIDSDGNRSTADEEMLKKVREEYRQTFRH